MKEENKRDLLRFFTGSTRIPLDGFDPPINITEGVDMLMVSRVGLKKGRRKECMNVRKNDSKNVKKKSA